MTATRSWPATSRRTFLAGMGLATGATTVPACSSGASTGVSPLDTFTALYEGAGSSETIDPGTATMFVDEARLKHVYDGLFEVDSTMTPIPRLARSAEPNADGTRWRLALRDAAWHDGSRFTSKDVLATLRRILGPQRRGSTASSSCRAGGWRRGRGRDRPPRWARAGVTDHSWSQPVLRWRLGA